jgi:hypothetical protein
MHVSFRAQEPTRRQLLAPRTRKGIGEPSAFVLLIGEKGLGAWQVVEYYEAIDRRVREPTFPVIPVLLEGQATPGLPF